ncbi:hypothetical protein BO82DRAFT_13888 [Aspergillus uvarum CBS 121591]|uniref:Uncharacterized protein n=4 Tax=Aspergillus TaxID=5052 RepID=A0A319BW09_9EURO|nr:hypothetical protein BO82DRAFT_13888 [Aspergillus uvarum CBS 121591]XP_025528070.1 hypothetical protein BO86DRAFT_312258 [Aspergillus japonicus CBS 114.51]PYI17614.1 hypothetical protein BO99DRAFT_190788 [Aspergillus violaceofuscus CBS 115571]PYI26970.1 hypothetical protein BP00DRAFT_38160 [Aspergillus indologenus CBS 114.80]PYH75729.1 hypothetical protein BO82DRAFT_13888 [Aspergillus uvarum CBS 121591]RAH82176.1 hypothetical protein BO86DRAFT_312258 [Aspergillus japonicus CBS 114.51]
MYPLLPWSQNQSSVRSSLSEATTSTQTVSFSFSYGSSCSPSSLPPPPPPSPSDSLLDITPRKCSFSSSYGLNNSCAFPSWPNRPSLLSADSEGSTASAYLSDEDLFPTGSDVPSDSAIDEESAAQDPAMDLTTEQQIQMLRAAADEDAQRARFLAQVQAHARAQQAMRVAQMAATERENAKRNKKRKAVPERKRRTTSGTKATICRV